MEQTVFLSWFLRGVQKHTPIRIAAHLSRDKTGGVKGNSFSSHRGF